MELQVFLTFTVLVSHLCQAIPTENDQMKDSQYSPDLVNLEDSLSDENYEGGEVKNDTPDTVKIQPYEEYYEGVARLEKDHSGMSFDGSIRADITSDAGNMLPDYESLVSMVQSLTVDYNNLMSIVQDQADVNRDLRQEVKFLYFQQNVMANELISNTTKQNSSSEEEVATDPWIIQGSGGSVYIRWGRDECPEVANKVYAGFAAGSKYDVGGGANFLCMPHDPIYHRATAAVDYRRAALFGIDYETDTFEPFAHLYEHDPPCAICETPGRSNVLMIPGRNVCPSGWTREYYGYLMSSHVEHRRSEFICVDYYAEARPGTAGENNGENFFPVEGTCSNGGGLPCGPYQAGKELTCAVCTK